MQAFFMMGALVLSTMMHEARGAAAAELLEKGIYTEETKGELEAASRIYQQIIDDATAERSLAAQAQLRLGLCQLKLGNKPQAISALERLTQEFPDKDKLMAVLDTQLPALLDELVQQIERNYIQEVDRGELVETAIRAIVGKLDARGGILRTNDMEFLSTSAVAQMNESLEQQIAGIGAVLRVDVATGDIVIQEALRHSPARKAGVKAGDRIAQIDDADLPDDGKLATVIKLLRGTPGSVVRLTVKRQDASLNFDLTRDTIRLPSVKGDHYKADDTWEFMVDDQRKIGYVRLTQVGKPSPSEMDAALKELQARGMKGMILDLRDNPGGALTEAIAIADLFVEHGTIVSVRGRSGEKFHEARPEGTFAGFPMAVLVNRQTASAAEIVAACLQDHQRAVVVGERTYGQAIVRAIFPLKSGVGALKLPVSAYYRPSGKNVNRYPGFTDLDDWGVKPDEGYEVADETPEVGLQDRQRQKALDYLHSLL